MTVNPPAEDANIALVDIVRYSDLPGRDQLRAIQKLTQIVRSTKTLAETPENRVFFLPTGDGMVVGFLGLPERPLELAREIHQQYGDQRFTLKIGIHHGLVFPYQDINGRSNYAGSSINMAQRVESCCEPGHILVAQPPAVALQDLAEWNRYLHGPPYTFRAKRSKEIRAYNFYEESEGVGNPSEPLGPARVFDTKFTTLAEALGRLGVVPHESLRYPDMQTVLGDHLAIDDAILDIPLRGFAGVPASDVISEMSALPRSCPDKLARRKQRFQSRRPIAGKST